MRAPSGVDQAIRDTEGKGNDSKGLAARLGYAGIGGVYATLVLSALRLALDRPDGDAGGGDATAQDRTTWLLSQPFGQYLVMAVGLVVVGVGLFQFYLAYTEKFRDSLRTAEMSGPQERHVRTLGRVAFGIIGLLLVAAGLHARPEDARGLGGELATLAEQPFGPWLLGAVAVGLVAYGVFMLVQARYRRIVVR